MATSVQPTARAPTEAAGLVTLLARRLHAALAESITAQQVAAYEEAIRHLKGVQRALDKAHN